MSTDLVYEDTQAGVVGANGIATLTFNGPPSLTTRQLATIVVFCSSSTPRPTATVYRRSIQPGSRLAATPVGNDDVFVADGETIQSGEPFFVQWTGAQVGATVRANAYGTDTRA